VQSIGGDVSGPICLRHRVLSSVDVEDVRPVRYEDNGGVAIIVVEEKFNGV
jgi:hypothetical protein